MGKQKRDENAGMKKVIASRSQRREAFMKLAGESFEELEGWYDRHAGASFEEIEQNVREARRRLMGQGLELLINQRGQSAEDNPPECPKCKSRMRLQDRRRRRVEGLEGSTYVERNYYVCPNGCGETSFPPRPSPTTASR